MRIAKSVKSRYDICIEWFNACEEIDQADKLSMFPFLNWHDQARHFADYCISIGENKIAEQAVESWENKK